jgi:HEPN domain-containing protein
VGRDRGGVVAVGGDRVAWTEEVGVANRRADLPESVRPGPELIDAGRVLDTFYIPTRYPDSHADGPPFEHYGRLHGEEALRHAGDVLAFVAEALADG